MSAHSRNNGTLLSDCQYCTGREAEISTISKLDSVSDSFKHGPLCLYSQLSWLSAPHSPADPNFTHKESDGHSNVFSTQHRRHMKKSFREGSQLGFICPKIKCFCELWWVQSVMKCIGLFLFFVFLIMPGGDRKFWLQSCFGVKKFRKIAVEILKWYCGDANRL